MFGCRAARQVFRDLYDLELFWIPCVQTLECIQKVKQAISEQEEEDTISSSVFACLVAGSLVLVVIVILVWCVFYSFH